MGTNFGFSKALSGFLMMMTQNGKLLYISDNAAEYLGHSMEDLLIHGDSVYDIIDKQDHQAVQSELLRNTPAPTDDERIFLCRMNVSRNARRQMRFGDQKVVLVQGHFLSFLPLCSRNEPVFLATCTPIAMPETRECVVQGCTSIFTSIHSMDMKFVHLDKNGEFHLGYTKDSIQGTSWYQLIHWDSIKEAQAKHRMITQADQDRACILLLRLQSHSGYWLWVHVVLQVKDNMEGSQHPVIVCTNQVLSEKEATVMRANSWLYHYYTVQSKLQYSLALESHAARMPTYYPSVMPYPHPQHGPPIQQEVSLHAQMLHHPPHHHTSHPHHHLHHHPHPHHHQPGLSSHNGSQHSGPAGAPQYSFPSSAYQHLSTVDTSPGPGSVYTRLAPLPSWIPVSNPSPLRYRVSLAEADEGHHPDDGSGYGTNLVQSPSSMPLHGVTCGMVQLVQANVRPMNATSLSAKYERKVRQLGARASVTEYGADEEEALTSCKDDVRSPPQSDPQTVPDLAAAVLVADRHGRRFHAVGPSRRHVPHDTSPEQSVPEFTFGCKDFKGSPSPPSEYAAWASNDGTQNAKMDCQRHWTEPSQRMHPLPSPPYSAGSSDYAVPHTPEGWPATPPLATVPSTADSPSKGTKKTVATRHKRRKVCKSPSALEVGGVSFTCNPSDVCACNVNTCSPLCVCLKYYDTGALRLKSADDWRCCSLVARNRDAMVSLGVPLLPKPFALKVRAEEDCALQWPSDAGMCGAPHPADCLPPSPPSHQGVLVTGSNGVSDPDDGHYRNVTPGEWSPAFCGQQCTRPACEHEDVPGCGQHKCRNG